MRRLLPLLVLVFAFGREAKGDGAGLDWPSPNRYRILLSVDTRGVSRSSSPASVELDLGAALATAGGVGTPDPDTLEVVALDAAGRALVHDASRAGTDRYLVPWRVERHYPTTRVALSFVVADERHTRFAVFFDTRESGNARPERYLGPVGDGDLLVEGFGRRELGPSGYDALADLDGDGDLDLFRGGTEPFVRCYENLGGSRFADRGWLTSGGQRLVLPHDPGHRSWASLAFADLDGDGDQDLFAHVWAGPRQHTVAVLENVTSRGGLLTFVDRGALRTRSGAALTDPVDFVDWDGDGDLDALSMWDRGLCLFRNVTPSGTALASLRLADAEPLRANGEPLALDRPRFAAADLDGDGDLDLLAGTDDGRVYHFENAGTRQAPLLRMGRALIHFEWMDCRTGLAVVDWDGDGRLDLLTGRYWERTRFGEQPRVYGRLYRNVGSRTRPRFEAQDATTGAPYTEQLQPVDTLRQSGVRVADWDEDGRPDLIVGDSDGFVSFHRNRTGGPAPLYAPGERLRAGDEPLRVWGEERELRAAGYARPEVADWDHDGLLDLLVADARAWVTFFKNVGVRGAPRLAAGVRLAAGGQALDGPGRGSVLVRDWDGDGRQDLLFAVSEEGGDAMGLGEPQAATSGVLFVPNRGSARSPQLGEPRPVRAGAGRLPIVLERPNLGDFVDWDGDGRRDLIVCEFENDVRLFRNSAPGSGRPRFDGPREGEMLLEAWTREMISGVQAVDTNGDGDLDLVTGQGHGGSGVRLFEHDFIRDGQRGSSPRVAVESVGAR